jgi:hypothetical protein
MNTINHYQVSAQLKTDKTGIFIELTQHDACGHPAIVCLYPRQLKAIHVYLGLIAADYDAATKIALTHDFP